MSHNPHKLVLPIKGMHCTSCELLIEKSLSEIRGVTKVEVSHTNGEAFVYYQNEQPSLDKLAAAIKEGGYEIGKAESVSLFSNKFQDYKDLAWAFVIILIGWWLIKALGLNDINIGGGSPKSIGVSILVGLVAGFSTCMAIIGGLTLGLSAKFAENHRDATAGQKFMPHLYFNFGRILGFGLLGGILGSIGSVFQLSTFATGTLTLFVAGVMIILGIQLTEISPKISGWKITLPKSIAKFLGINQNQKEYSHRGAMIMGALTFFLPCGFTQAMQLFAVTSGSFVSGALIMALFALGTAPGLLSIGGLTSVLTGKKAKLFFKFSGLVVVFLGLYNFANALTIAGLTTNLDAPSKIEINDPNVTMANGVQTVKMTENNSGYSPNQFTIKKGVPVRWIINAKAPYSCASSLIVPKLGIRKTLKAGENVIEFTPKEAGKLPFSCSMGMYTGVFNVVDESVENTDSGDSSDTAVAAASGKKTGSSSCGGSAGGCGGCGGGKKIVADSVPTTPEIDSVAGVQLLKTTYTADNFLSPNTFKVKAGTPVRLEIEAKDSGSGCGYAIMVPGLYDDAIPLVAGQTVVMEFTPDTAGEFDITCSMNMIHYGSIVVE